MSIREILQKLSSVSSTFIDSNDFSLQIIDWNPRVVQVLDQFHLFIVKSINFVLQLFNEMVFLRVFLNHFKLYSQLVELLFQFSSFLLTFHIVLLVLLVLFLLLLDGLQKVLIILLHDIFVFDQFLQRSLQISIVYFQLSFSLVVCVVGLF